MECSATSLLWQSHTGSRTGATRCCGRATPVQEPVLPAVVAEPHRFKNRCYPLRALLLALVEPTAKLREAEIRGDYTARLAMLEEIKTLPSGAVWDHYCLRHDVPVGLAWLEEIKKYEKDVLSKR
ncbi:MAG: L-rhamnose isomerase [Pirellulales bacterium]|nr:L-rhamnose isomerase [Pirellulales bacterium]